MTPAQLALAAAALFVCAHADLFSDSAVDVSEPRERHIRLFSKSELPSGCLYEGRWHNDGATVTTHEECLRCVCIHGALTCRRRACTPLPDPLPRRCHVRHRRGSCCPEMHCPNAVTSMEHGAAARFEDEELADVATPASISHACVEGGTVYAAGSAMGSGTACEQCFCLRGARRCVRPTCMPPPPHCAPRPSPGACCPQRYYCDRTTDTEQDSHQYDCLEDGQWILEGASVPSSRNCTACFCLRGEVRCQALGCAPPLSGCRPLLALGDCCARQYICDHYHRIPQKVIKVGDELFTAKYLDRAFHSSMSSKHESTTKKLLTSVYTVKHTPYSSATKQHLITTTKVKRKTDEPASTKKSEHNSSNTTSVTTTTTEAPFTSGSLKVMLGDPSSEASLDRTTEQPEGTVKIVINGTVNCTAELSSTSLPLGISLNDTERIQMEAMPRVPIVNIEAQTYSPNDIITDRSVNGFDENDSFTINVTSLLMTNTSHSTSRPVMSVSKIPAPDNLADSLNSSKKTKGDYDYDYTEPTLPPSLPNLKIIPFVAADAVVDDEPTKETLTYPILEREDKFPVYYPGANPKDTAFPTRRDDTYHPTQYPVFISEKLDSAYPTMSQQDVDLTSNRYPVLKDMVREYTVTTSLGSHLSEAKAVTNVPSTSSTFEMKTPAVNLFSPPVETEGGFVPKGPGVLDEYFAVYASTPSAASVPHLTTSMQLDINKDACMTQDGRPVAEGESVSLYCDICTCAWGQLRCLPRTDAVCLTDNNTNSGSILKIKKDKYSHDQYSDSNFEEESRPETTPAPATSPTPASLSQPNTTVSVGANHHTTEQPTVNNTANHTRTEPVQTTTTEIPPATARPTAKVTISSTPAPSKDTNDSSKEYEDDDDDDGFSLGSMLKLLLSDTYESTTPAPTKKNITKLTRTPTPTPSPRRPSTVAPFIPLPPQPYKPQNSPNMVNRIDHLVLGEATAIKRTTHRPITNKTTKRPMEKTTTERRPEIKDESGPLTSGAHGGPRPPNVDGLTGVAPGLLKLAGCNIYGRMYRVGRIIAELSTPCQECWCTELGVQCKSLSC